MPEKQKMPHALVVEDDPQSRRGLCGILERRGFRTSQASTLSSAEARVRAARFDAVLLDLLLPDGSGLDLLLELGRGGSPHVVLISGDQELAQTLHCMDFRSLQFLPKPLDVQELERVLAEIRRSAESQEDARDPAQVALLGSSPQMRQVRSQLEIVAPTRLHVWLQGETGTGKELVARKIHELSPRREQRFVAMNCGAFPESLIDSQLFGHLRGAFTGAEETRRGAFEVASGGTLFLDELTEMPLSLQARLLRAVESQRIRPVGCQDEIPVDVRVIAASNRDPREQVKKGLLREDLYHRIAVFPVHLPPLRERDGDVRMLAREFWEDFGRSEHDLGEDAARALEGYAWPGNVRELRNVMQRLSVYSNERIGAEDVRAQLDVAPTSAPDFRSMVGRTIAELERKLIEATLAAKGGDKNAAARTLGISVRTLYNRLHCYKR